MSEYDEHLKAIYTEFATFGANRVTSQYSVFLDGPRFAKFAKDCKLLDKTNLTATDVDLIFAKSKAKTERRITFDQFRVALSMMAEKKYPNLGSDDAFSALAKKIISAQGPTANATQTATGGIYDKLTDASLYTGSHKERFHADGTGKGLDGRDSISKGKGSHSLKTTASFDDGERPDGAQPEEGDDEDVGDDNLAEEVSKLEVAASPSKTVKTPAKTTLSYSPPTKASPSGSSPARKPAATTRSPTASATTRSPTASATTRSPTSSTKSPTKTTTTTTAKSPAKSPTTRTASPTKKVSIFDKLTDSSQYTGAHKNRFNADGTGRGLAGRDSVAKSGVSGKDLSQMVKRK